MNARELKMSPTQLLAEQARQKADRASSRRRTAPRRAEERETREAKREARRTKVAAIRDAVFARAKGKCEVCRYADASDAHHVLSGPDRRKYEAADTMLALCRECHGLIHRGEPGTLDSAQNVCIVNGMTRAAFAIGRRLAKIEALRARPGREERTA